MKSGFARVSPVKRHHRRRAWSYVLAAAGVLMIIFIGLGLLSHVRGMMITSVSVKGAQILNNDEVSHEVLAHLSGNYALLYARGNKFLFSKKEAAAFIMNTFPRVYRVDDIELVDKNVTVAVTEREGVAVWCGETAPAYGTEYAERSCYFIDQTGFVFDRAPFFTNGVYLTFYGGLSDGDPIGQTLMLAEGVEAAYGFAAVMKSLRLPVHSILLSSDGQHAALLDMPTTTGTFAKILWNEEIKFVDIENKIAAAVAEETLAKSLAEQRGELLYIDARFKNRVFYKFQE